MKDKILENLQEIESQENAVAFYVCESGSRAWGFPSVDSDYDIRFLYVHPMDWYLSIVEKRDVIERPLQDQLDINGWDLKKALVLFRKSNPPLLEWLNSPIVYHEKYTIASQLRELSKTYYSPSACVHHYLHMAQGNVREYLKGERVWLKKYFYVLRPLLAIKWIEEGHGIAPTSFEALIERIEKLLKAKLMMPAGLAKINAAKKDGSWNALDAVEALEIPSDLEEAFSKNGTARGYFEAFPRSVKRAILEWISHAKRHAIWDERSLEEG